jgi:hypothetical protein
MDTRRVAGVLVSLVILNGCSTPSSDSPSRQPPSDEPTGAAQIGDARDIVMVVDGEPSLKEDYATIRELAASKNLVAVVHGTISATRDVYLERFAFRILTVNVTEGLHGHAEAQITVLEEGGVVPYALAAKDIPPKDFDPHTPRSTAGNIDFRFLGARHSEPGDEVILFLGLNPNRGTVIETTYNMISSVHGRFTYDTKSSAFVRSLGSPDGDLRAGFVTSTDIGKLRAEIAAAHP